jgi:hypothetical protein
MTAARSRTSPLQKFLIAGKPDALARLIQGCRAAARGFAQSASQPGAVTVVCFSASKQTVDCFDDGILFLACETWIRVWRPCPCHRHSLATESHARVWWHCGNLLPNVFVSSRGTYSHEVLDDVVWLVRGIVRHAGTAPRFCGLYARLCRSLDHSFPACVSQAPYRTDPVDVPVIARFAPELRSSSVALAPWCLILF